MRIENTKVYGIDETARASGYPMLADMERESGAVYEHMARLHRLGRAKSGSGHDCALKGIIVQADITAPQYWWLQFGRYHFTDIISSQSKMHRILEMDLDKQCNKYVDPKVRDYLGGLVRRYNKLGGEADETAKSKTELYQRVIANCPMGLMLTARITTNYLQIKTMYYQRRNHKLEEWRIFCNWATGELPLFARLIGEDKP